MNQRALVPEPVVRNLRIFTFDPSVAAQFDTAGISEITVGVQWEKDLLPGPVGEYLEVIDADPASGVFYKPVELSDSSILATNGLAPSESNPQFHQQMVYAVAMTTIRHFEDALGRVALWSSHREQGEDRRIEDQFVRRLRIYPHALRDRNAYYSPSKKALLFGYFPVSIKDANNTPGTLVFTCLSHDIVAHETTHALLDGVHPRFNEAVNEDVLAFHEAFADIIALFQHFSYPGVLRDQIARSRGNLANDSLLAQLAQQFGKATGRGDSLRSALGAKPDVHALENTFEPHDRGAILMAAVFGTFLKVYRARTRDLYRIASDGSGVLREGDIHPDLSGRLADEAARAAQHVLQMCIRAIDACPPVDITFGDYLRGIVTADYDLNPEDRDGYRLAFIESFRQWGIFPKGMRSMSVESLLWPSGEDFGVPPMPDDRIRDLRAWNLESDRLDAWKQMDRHSFQLWNWIVNGQASDFLHAFGLNCSSGAPTTVFRSKKDPLNPAVEVHSVRMANRRSPRGSMVTDLVVEITQRRRGYLDPDKQKKMDKAKSIAPDDKGDFIYRAGCTLLIDPYDNMRIRRIIRTPGTITDDSQLDRVRRFLTGEAGAAGGNAFVGTRLAAREPFAMLHFDGEGD